MKCPWCGKHIPLKRIKSARKFADGTHVYYEYYHCVKSCGYKKGQTV